MRRLITLALVSGLLLAGASVPRMTSPAVASHSSVRLGKKVCPTKKVHGKKKKVCKTVKPKPAPITELTSGEQIDAYLAKNNFRGVMLFEKRGNVLLGKGYGKADSATNTPNTLQTKFPAFAVSEFLVAVALMKLQEQGKLSIHDAICRYISNCPAAWQSITLEELLTDTSGISAYDPLQPSAGSHSPGQTMVACQALPLAGVPGVMSPRSLCNRFLLSTILEKVTGQSWADAMHEMIFGPAGMANSGQMSNALLPPQRMRGHRTGSPVAELNYDSYPMAYSTVEDIQRFDHALLAGNLINQQSRDAMFTPRLADDPPDNTVYRAYDNYIQVALARKDSSYCQVQFQESSGEAEYGEEAGIRLDNAFCPVNGSVWIYATNDVRLFTNDDENHLFDLTSRLMWNT